MPVTKSQLDMASSAEISVPLSPSSPNAMWHSRDETRKMIDGPKPVTPKAVSAMKAVAAIASVSGSGKAPS